MAYSNTKNGTGIDAWAYIYVQLQVTRTDYATYSHFELKSVAVSDTGSSSYIKGQVTTNQAGTSWTAQTGWKSVTRNGTTTLATSSFDVTRGTEDKTAVCKAYAQGGGTEIYAGGEDYATLNVTVPRVLTPNGPSSALIHQPWEDTSVRLYWTNGATSDERPRDATLVERKTDDNGSWVQIASVSSSTSNYTDNSITVNHKYFYRVRAKNTAGYSEYAFAFTDIAQQDHILTTPAAPSNVTASLSSSSTVVVNATSNSPYAHGYEVQRTADGGQTWQEVVRSETLPISDSAPAGTVQYRMLAFIDDRESPWSYSNELVTICPPLAPTITSTPSNPSVVDTAATITWTPNHPDGSSQQAAQVKLTNPSGTELIYAVQSNYYQFTPTQSGTWTVQVRTKGIDPSWGAWSDAVSWGVYALPTVNIENPASDSTVIAAMPFLVRWEAADETGISSQVVTMNDSNGRKIYERSFSPSYTYVYIGTQDVELVNGDSYSVTVTVMAGSGLKATAVRQFAISWIPPEAPTLEIGAAEGQSAEIRVLFEDGTITTQKVTVQRIYRGTVWTIAENVSDGETVRDPLPPLGTEVEYRGISYATSGASAESSTTEVIGGNAWALNFGNAAEECVELLYGRRNGRGLKHGGKSYHLADGGEGGGLPVFYPTTDRDQSGSLRFTVIYNDDADRLFELCDAYPVGWIRDDRGRRWRAHIEPSEEYGDNTGPTYNVAVNWTADRWREAW